MKKSTRRGLVYFRYILPVATAVGFFALMFIPCYRFITADTGVNLPISLWELLGNAWETAKEYIFGNGDKLGVTLDFAKTLMCVVVALWTLFAVGAISAVYSAVTAFRYFGDADKQGRYRILYLTLTVNRIVLCALHALMLPIFFLPRIMPLLYGDLLNYHVELVTSPFDMLWIAIALFAASCAVTAISRNSEVVLQMNVYSRPRADEDDGETEDLEQDGTESEYTSMSDREKAEQTERILRLLKNQSQENDGEDNK